MLWPSFPESFFAARLARGACTALVAALLVAPAAHATPATLNGMVQAELTPQLDDLFRRLNAEGDRITLDGVPALQSGDKFLPGKIALGIADLIEARPAEERRAYLEGFRRIAD